MKTGLEYINGRHVVFVSELGHFPEEVELQYGFYVDCVNQKQYYFYFASREYTNQKRNEIIKEAERANGN